jgi:hypothetical protein
MCFHKPMRPCPLSRSLYKSLRHLEDWEIFQEFRKHLGCGILQAKKLVFDMREEGL